MSKCNVGYLNFIYIHILFYYLWNLYKGVIVKQETKQKRNETKRKKQKRNETQQKRKVQKKKKTTSMNKKKKHQ